MKKTTKLPIAAIVIPTYNEADSIGRMIDYLFSEVFPNIPKWHCQVLVVDDTSPDGTYKVVQQKQQKYHDLFLSLSATKSGIGGAYVRGFKYAMKELAADVIIEMDGDFQHPPKGISLLLDAVNEGYDYVIGSRKIKGGSNPAGWGFKRLFFSEVGGFVARTIMFFPFKPFFQITDPTTGFKASRVKGFVDKLDMDHLYSRSFAYKIEFLFKMVKLHAKVKEIPLKFQVRNAGESKIEPQTAKDIFQTAILLRWHDDFTQKFLKFGTVGFIGYLINASLLQLVTKSTNVEWLGWLLSTEAAIISNFTLNNIWTFKSEKITVITQLITKFLTFNLTSAGALLIQTVFGTLGVLLLGSQYRQLLLPLIILFLVLPYNWLMYNKFIWNKKKTSQK